MLKTVQFRPSYIYLMTWSRDHLSSFDLAAMTEVASEYASEIDDKPLCNIVLLFNEGENPDTWDTWEFPVDLAAASTGVKASGYRIVTSPEPIDNADMYYIFTRGVWEAPPLDLSDTVIQLFDSGKPVFLQVTHRLLNETTNWNIARTKLGLDDNPYAEIANTGGILHGTFNGVPYSHSRLGWEHNASSLLDLRPENDQTPADSKDIQHKSCLGTPCPISITPFVFHDGRYMN